MSRIFRNRCFITSTPSNTIPPAITTGTMKNNTYGHILVRGNPVECEAVDQWFQALVKNKENYAAMPWTFFHIVNQGVSSFMMWEAATTDNTTKCVLCPILLLDYPRNTASNSWVLATIKLDAMTVNLIDPFGGVNQLPRITNGLLSWLG